MVQGKIRSVVQLTGVCLLTICSSSLFAADDNNYFVAGIGLLSSSEQKNVMSQTYSDYAQSGGGAMINIEAGYSFGISDNVSIMPKINYLAFLAEFRSTNSSVGSMKSNTFFIPGLSLRYDFGQARNRFYISASLGKNSPSSDFSRVNEIKSNGNVTGIAAGFALGHFQFEIGTMKIPVIISTDSVAPTSLDFGGTYFTLKRSM
ncbi:MAG TPA: hypothetical protein ENI97_15155 [Gammaproteobacteria bacterium]|nr:hypothetical protein [Gammaproteobacteria bacterium]